MFFRRDWIFSSFMNNFNMCYIDFKSNRASLIFSDFSMNNNRTFLRQCFNFIKELFRYITFKKHTLNNSRSITKFNKYKLSTGTLIIHPAFKSYVFIYIFADINNIMFWCHRNPFIKKRSYNISTISFISQANTQDQ